MILFLNKIDLLNRKLHSGVKINQYLPSYGERSNDTATVVRCGFLFSFFSFPLFAYSMTDLRTKFKDILKQNSTEERYSYYHATTVTVRCFL